MMCRARAGLEDDPIPSPAGLADASRDQRRERRQLIAAQHSDKDRGQRQQVDAALYVAIRGLGPCNLGYALGSP